MTLQRILDAARRHAEQSEPDHEVGDLIAVLRAIWPLIPEKERRTVIQREPIAGLLRDWGTLEEE